MALKNRNDIREVERDDFKDSEIVDHLLFDVDADVVEVDSARYCYLKNALQKSIHTLLVTSSCWKMVKKSVSR